MRIRLVSESRVGLLKVLRIWSKSTTGLVAFSAMAALSANGCALSVPGVSCRYFWPSSVARRIDADVSPGSGQSPSSTWKVTVLYVALRGDRGDLTDGATGDAHVAARR